VAKMAVNALCIACLVDEARSLESKVGLESKHRRHPGFVLNSSVREASRGHAWQKVASGSRPSQLGHASQGRGLVILREFPPEPTVGIVVTR